MNMFRELKLYFYLIFKGGGGNLLTPDNMNNLCKLYRQYVLQFPDYALYFFTATDAPHHLPNYIASLAKKPDCDNTTQIDIDRLKTVLKNCVVYYRNSTLKECAVDYKQDSCNSMKSECQYNDNLVHSSSLPNLIYNTFFYLTDNDFVNNLDHLEVTGKCFIYLKKVHTSEFKIWITCIFVYLDFK